MSITKRSRIAASAGAVVAGSLVMTLINIGGANAMVLPGCHTDQCPPPTASASASPTSTSTPTPTASATPTDSSSATPTDSATPTASPSVGGVTLGTDGWISYTNGQAASLGVTNSQVTTINGTLNADGTCTFDYDYTGTSGTPTYQEEVGYNPTTCQDRILTGSMTNTAEASLVSPTDTNTVAESPQAAQASGDATADVTPAAQPYSTSGLQSTQAVTPDSTSYSSAHTKTAWIDPVNITITSLTTNLSWPLYGAGGWVNARNNAYKFAYDGWSTSGTPSPVISGTSSGWSTGGYETFRNTDFEHYVIAVFGVSGWAACGFSTAPAIFTHNVRVNGNRNGSYYSSWNDTKSGGCSNLVHHRTSYGYGWTS